MSKSIVASIRSAIARRTIRSLHTSEVHSETKRRNRIIFDNITQKNIGNSMSKIMIPNTFEHAPYSDGVDLDSVQLPDDDDPLMHDGTDFF